MYLNRSELELKNNDKIIIDFHSWQRFWNKIDKTSTCWIWKGSLTSDGYGDFSIGKKRFSSHRLAYELIVDLIPEGLELDHLCRNPACCNPEHLEPVSARENVLRGIGPSAQNIRKSHCIRGHELSTGNIIIKNRRRICKQCREHHQCSEKAKARSRKWRLIKKKGVNKCI